jgi:imidazole glycerol-phosphate synthase subunit HisF
MSKYRVIAVINVLNGRVVQSIGFNKYLPVGDPVIIAEALNDWGCDEIVLVDIGQKYSINSISPKIVHLVSSSILVPLAVGGGVTSLREAENLIRNGADKIVIGSTLYSNPKLIDDISKVFGSQCVIGCIDVLRNNHKTWTCYARSGTEQVSCNVGDMAKQIEQDGVGEILINSIDRDGSKHGYDEQLIRQISSSVNVPVIALGGCGHPKDVQRAFIAGARAAAIGNMLHYTEHSVSIVKGYLRQSNISVRNDADSNYTEHGFDIHGRLQREDDNQISIFGEQVR